MFAETAKRNPDYAMPEMRGFMMNQDEESEVVSDSTDDDEA